MLHHKKSESCGFQTFCLRTFHKCCLEEPKLQFCFRVLIREAAGLAAGMRCDLVPAHLPEADVRPAFAVLPAGSFTLYFSRGCRYAMLYHPAFNGIRFLHGPVEEAPPDAASLGLVALNIIKQIPSSSLSGSPAPSRTDPLESFGRLTIRRRGVSRRFFLGRNQEPQLKNTPCGLAVDKRIVFLSKIEQAESAHAVPLDACERQAIFVKPQLSWIGILYLEKELSVNLAQGNIEHPFSFRGQLFQRVDRVFQQIRNHDRQIQVV